MLIKFLTESFQDLLGKIQQMVFAIVILAGILNKYAFLSRKMEGVVWKCTSFSNIILLRPFQCKWTLNRHAGGQ